ncbi:UNVERIFIED_CONTAM: hypothetical protein GTU68_039212 [Idotea baltica]|nr:hypothetical protein [Idotea baltica]
MHYAPLLMWPPRSAIAPSTPLRFTETRPKQAKRSLTSTSRAIICVSPQKSIQTTSPKRLSFPQSSRA